MTVETDDWARVALDPPRAYGEPECSARLRVSPDDFQVDEDLGFPPDGDGQHVLLRIRKRNVNTEWLARVLARAAAVPVAAVGYAGLKDRRALTSQWFSVDLAGREEPDWGAIEDDDVRVLARARHRRKLRRGALRANSFRIVMRELQGMESGLPARLDAVGVRGVPNYFGPQRFGRDGANLRHARDMLLLARRVKDRHRRGLYLSAARALLFNLVLARRVTEASWDRILPGEAVMLDGSHSFFVQLRPDDDIERRVAGGDIHPSGPLWGRGTSPALEQAGRVERETLTAWEPWQRGLEAAGLKQERRPLRVRPAELRWTLHGDALELRFRLPPGSYATAVVRELCRIADAVG